MKKQFMMLSCIAAVAIATVVGKKTFESHAYETSNLLLQNVEALADDNDTPKKGYNHLHLRCYDRIQYGGQYVTVPNKKHSATCWENQNSKDPCHKHECMECPKE